MDFALVPGFNVSDRGNRTVRKLEPSLKGAGHRVVVFRYGRASLRDVYFARANLVEALLSFLEVLPPDVILVGHSNGCNLIHHATHNGATSRAVAYIAPALDRNLVPGKRVSHWLVFHTRTDMAVRAATYLPCLSWGRQGAFGPSVADPRLECVDGYPLGIRSHGSGRRGWFRPRGVAIVGARLVSMAAELPPLPQEPAHSFVMPIPEALPVTVTPLP